MKTPGIILVTALCVGLCPFAGDALGATVTATLKNVNNNNAPAAGTRIKIYTSPARELSGSNPASFANVAAGTYTIEGYYSGTFWGEEFWASTDVSVPSSGTVTPTLPRQYAIATSVVIKNHATGATISSGQSVNAGTQLRVEVTIQNNLPGTTLNSRPHVAIDRSQSTSYDFDLNWTSQPVNGNGATRLFSTTFTPNTTGQYYFAYEVWTTLANNNTLRTDSAGWQQTFQIVCPTPDAPTSPNPSDTATGVSTSLSLLNWADASGATSYDVYFGTDSTPDSGEFRQNVSSSQWTIDQSLNEATTYYWKIVSKNSCGSTDGPVWRFTTGRTTGDVTATLRNVSGADAPAGGTRIKLYTSPSREASGVNPASFATVPPGTYTIEGYYTGTFWGEEYWASTEVSVTAGQVSTPVLPRRYPYVTGVVFKNHATGATLAPGQTVNPGTQLRAEVTVRNDVPGTTLNVAIRLAIDISQSAPYDFDLNAPAQPVNGSGGTRLYTLTFTPTAGGQLYYAYQANTTLANGSTLPTDSAGWQQTVQVNAPALTISGRVAFHSYSGYFATPTDANDGHVFLYGLPSGSTRKLTQGLAVENAMNPHISADGSRITFMAIPQGAARNRSSLEIYVYDLATETLARLTSNSVPDEDGKFSPDGQKIVFKRSNQVWTMNSDGTGQAQITTTGEEKSGPNYSPDGAHITYWSDSGANADIWRMTAGGSGATKIVGTVSLQEYYPIYRDAQTILFTRWESTSDTHDKIYSYSVASGSAQALAVNQAGANDSDSFPVDGSLIGFSSDRGGGKYDLFIGNPTTGTIYALPAANTIHHDLGGWYSPYSNARKVVVLNPVDGAQITSGSSITLTVRAYSNGGVWSGAAPKVVLQGPANFEFTGLHDDGINGDVSAGDGIYSTSVTLPSQAGSYSVYGSASSVDNGLTHEIRSSSLSVTLQEPPDTTAPTVAISSPTSGQTFATASITVTGTASDPGRPSTGVNLVEVRVNSGGWQTANGTASWSRSVTLVSGSNLLEARSRDGAGLYSSIPSVTVTFTPPNNPSQTPANVSPTNGATNQPLALTLQASGFSDPDPGDTHSASQWLVRRVSDGFTVFDSGEDVANRTTLPLPLGMLNYGTSYNWQVRYKDNRGAWSSYSPTTVFSTEAPSLQTTRQGNDMVFSWPTNTLGFALEYITSLPGTNWFSASPAPVVVGGQNVVTNTMAGSARFYRLKK